MDFALSDEIEDYRRRVRDFVAQHIVPLEADPANADEHENIRDDVLQLVRDEFNIDENRIYLWGHSMGGEITLRTLLASQQIKAASMWSSVGGNIWDQSYYYSRSSDPMAPDSSETRKSVVTELRRNIADLDSPFDSDLVEPYLYLADLDTPIIIHHAIDDTGAAYKWSQQLAKELFVLGKTYEFWSVPGDAHLFDDKQMEVAADRDVAFFQSVAP